MSFENTAVKINKEYEAVVRVSKKYEWSGCTATRLAYFDTLLLETRVTSGNPKNL